MSAQDEVFEIDPRGFLAEEAETADASAEGIASLERIEQELADVELALTRLDEGRYGTCDTCRAGVADGRLAEHPAERFCDAHQPGAQITDAE